MLVHGSVTGEPIRVGEDPRYILAGRRIVEVYRLGDWLPGPADVRRAGHSWGGASAPRRLISWARRASSSRPTPVIRGSP